MVDGCPFHKQHNSIEQFDMLDPHSRECPHFYYQWLQSDKKNRVYAAPKEKSFYVVHEYDDVKFVLTNSKLFSSAILPTKRSPFLALMDGADHLRQREIVNKIFQVDDSLFPRNEVHQYISSITDNLVKQRSGDVIDAWAMPIPLASLCILFGIEPTEKTIRQLHHQSIIINKALFVLGGTGPRRSADPNFSEKLSIAFSLVNNFFKIRRIQKAVGKEGWISFKQMFLPVKSIYENPRPDFKHMPQALSCLLDLMLLFNDALDDGKNNSHGAAILREAINEHYLTKVETIMLCTFILFAGYETSVSLLSNSVYHLARNNEHLIQLKNKPESIELFIEEVLRFYTPVGRFLRRANEDIKIGDHLIPKGAMVIAMLGAANVDQARVTDPYSFIPDRDKNQHMSFGKGIHFCVGAPLARLQSKLALEELLKRVHQIDLEDSKKLAMVTDRDNGILRLEELWISLK